MVIFDLAERTATINDSTVFQSASGIFSLIWHITAIDGTPPTLTLQILVEDPVDGAYKVWKSFGLTQNSAVQTVYHVGSGDTPASDVIAQKMPRAHAKLRVIHSNPNGATYSISKLER